MATKSTREQIIDHLSVVPVSTGTLAGVLGVTQQAVHKHLSVLRAQGLARQVGKGRAAKWVGCFDRRLTWDLVGDATLGESEMWQQAKDTMAVELAAVNDNALAILNYTVTEILNNAIDHSGGTQVELLTVFDGDDVEITVVDDGVGAFKKVQDHFGLSNEMEAVAHLAKGQQTTWAERHTGQGLFFSSRAVELFELEAGGRLWQVDNRRGDTTVMASVQRPGTRVVLRTSKERTMTMKEFFQQFSIEEHAFDRGAVRVALSDYGTQFVSRSEAKRLGIGLELYGEVELDFRDVKAVGQGFVDELFRVWIREHPGTTFSYINANEEVTFMIERGLPSR